MATAVAYRLRAVNASEALGLPRLDEGLERLEPLLTASVVTGDAFLDEVTTHLIAAGGKRLRPLLALAAPRRATVTPTEDDLMGAVAVELVHLASLYHDDVMDEATIRRNVESVNSRFGNLVAIVAGDYLLARSAAIAAGLGTEIAGLLADTLGQLCQGQVSEVRSAFQTERTQDDYFDRHRRQDGGPDGHLVPHRRADRRRCPAPRSRPAPSSAAASAWSSRSATTSSTSPPPRASCGSRPGQDLAEGIYTLPGARGPGRSGRRPRTGALLGKPLDQPERDKARAIVAGSPGIAAAVAAGRRYVEPTPRRPLRPSPSPNSATAWPDWPPNC